MRNFLGKSAPVVVTPDVISLEEEALLVDEAATAGEQATTDLDDAERANDVSEALEDLAVIADDIEEPTENEVALIENTANMAVAGTDIPSEEVVPAMESYREGGKIAMEAMIDNIKKTAAEIWNKILEILKNTWKSIEEFFYKFAAPIPRKKKLIADLEKKVTELGRAELKEGAKTFKLPASAAVSVDFNPVKNAPEYLNALSAYNSVVKEVFTGEAGRVVGLGNAIKSGLDKFDVSSADKAKASLADLVSSLYAAELKPVIKMSSAGGTGSTHIARSEPLLGNVSIFQKTHDINKSVDDVLANATAVRNNNCFVAPTRADNNVMKADKTVEFTPLSSEQMKAVLKTAGEILSTMEEYNRSTGYKNIVKAKEAVTQSSGKLKEKMGAVKDAPKEIEAYYRSALNFNISYARSANSPFQAFMKNSMNVANAAIVMVEKSLALYGAKVPASDSTAVATV